MQEDPTLDEAKAENLANDIDTTPLINLALKKLEEVKNSQQKKQKPKCPRCGRLGLSWGLCGKCDISSTKL